MSRPIMHERDSIDQLRLDLIADIERLAEALLGEPTQRKTRECRWGAKGSLSLEIAGPRRGVWHCHEVGAGGGPLQLIQHARRCELREAIAWARNWLGVDHRRSPTSPPSKPRASAEPVQTSTVELARRIWIEAVPAAETIAERYLRSRGLQLPTEAPLRFHPECHRGAERVPAMVAMMTNPVTGHAVGVHRTFLKPDGSGKADGQAKMMVGAAGVIRLVPDTDVTFGLGITEGIENALAILQHASWRPVWACGSAGAIRTFPVLRGIECVSIFADADDRGAGLEAARVCAKRWADAGVEAVIRLPPDGADWNDVTRGDAA